MSISYQKILNHQNGVINLSLGLLVINGKFKKWIKIYMYIALASFWKEIPTCTYAYARVSKWEPTGQVRPPVGLGTAFWLRLTFKNVMFEKRLFSHSARSVVWGIEDITPCPTKPKVFTIWLFMEVICWPLLYTKQNKLSWLHCVHWNNPG